MPTYVFERHLQLLEGRRLDANVHTIYPVKIKSICADTNTETTLCSSDSDSGRLRHDATIPGHAFNVTLSTRCNRLVITGPDIFDSMHLVFELDTPKGLKTYLVAFKVVDKCNAGKGRVYTNVKINVYEKRILVHGASKTKSYGCVPGPRNILYFVDACDSVVTALVHLSAAEILASFADIRVRTALQGRSGAEFRKTIFAGGIMCALRFPAGSSGVYVLERAATGQSILRLNVAVRDGAGSACSSYDMTHDARSGQTRIEHGLNSLGGGFVFYAKKDVKGGRQVVCDNCAGVEIVFGVEDFNAAVLVFREKKRGVLLVLNGAVENSMVKTTERLGGVVVLHIVPPRTGVFEALRRRGDGYVEASVSFALRARAHIAGAQKQPIEGAPLIIKCNMDRPNDCGECVARNANVSTPEVIKKCYPTRVKTSKTFTVREKVRQIRLDLNYFVHNTIGVECIDSLTARLVKVVPGLSLNGTVRFDGTEAPFLIIDGPPHVTVCRLYFASGTKPIDVRIEYRPAGRSNYTGAYAVVGQEEPTQPNPVSAKDAKTVRSKEQKSTAYIWLAFGIFLSVLVILSVVVIFFKRKGMTACTRRYQVASSPANPEDDYYVFVWGKHDSFVKDWGVEGSKQEHTYS